MTPPVIVCGGGGHAKVLIGVLKRTGRHIMGVVDADPRKKNTQILGVAVLGGDDVLDQFAPEAIELVNGIGSTGDCRIRAALFDHLRARGFHFSSVIDPSAMISEDVTLGEGAQILAGAVLQPGVRIGDNVIVNTHACLDHDTVVGAHTHIAPGAVLSGNVRLGERTHVGTGAALRQGVTVGDGAVVGVGAAVVTDVPAKTIVVGVPARRLET